MSTLKDFMEAMKNASTEKTKAYDTTATVTRIEGSTAWVHIPGGVDETPVKLTIAAKEGDAVQVRVSGGRAWLQGNATAPPTDDTTAYIAYSAANTAQQDAVRAFTAAENAEQDAARAHDAADRAEASAEEAKTQATRATGYANDSLAQLSIVEDVVGTLNWITTHATYKATEDTEVRSGKWYFTKSGDTYNVVINPTGDPTAQGWYEIDTIDEAVSNYVSSHLALTDAGLWVVKDNQGYKILLANDGLKIYDDTGHLVSTFGESITFDSERPQTIGNNSTYIKFYDSNNDSVADKIEISGDVTLTNSVTIGGMPTDISDLTDTSGVIPTDVSDLNNDAGYQTASDVSGAIDSATSNMLSSVTVKDRYYLSISSSSATGGSWQDTVPTWSSGKYIWTRVATTKTTASGSNTTYSTAVYDSALTSALSTATSAQASANSAASTVVTTKQYYLSTSSSSATGSSWGDSVPIWSSGKYIWVRFKIVKTPVSGTATTTYTPSENGTYDSALTTALSTASAAAPKSSAVNKTVSVYYRSTAHSTPSISTSTSIGTSSSTDNAWEYIMPGPKRDCYFYTCEEYTYADNTRSFSTVRELTSETYTSKWVSSADATYIDGGRLYANSVTADQIQTNSITVGSLSDGSSYSTTTQMNSAIGTAVDGIEIGGRNLLVGTGTSKSKTTTTTSGFETLSLYETPNQATLEELGYKDGDKVTLSFDWAVTNATTYGNARIEWYGKTGSSEMTYLGVVINPFATFSSTYLSDHVEKTVTLSATTINAKKLVMRIDNSNLTVTISNLKLEKGNKATDWTPAPEDVQAEIDAKKSIHTLVTNLSYTYANILTYSAEGYSKSGGWAVTDASGVKVGDTARLKVTASDMGTGGTAVYVVGTVTAVSGNTVTMTSHGLDTTVIDGGHILTGTIDANRISSSVVNAINANVSDTINGNKINASEINIGSLAGSIGGRNLLKGTSDITVVAYAKATDEYGLYYKSGTGTLTSHVFEANSLPFPVPTGTCLKVTTTEANTYVGISQLKQVKKTAYCYSAWVKGTAGDTVRLGTIYSGTAGIAESQIYTVFTIADSDWHKYEITFTPQYDHIGDADCRAPYVFVKSATVGREFYICGIKLEYGDKSTDWTPAPEDDGGGANLVPYPYYRSYASGNPWTENGITWTENADGSITATGTATATTSFIFTGTNNAVNPNGIYCMPAGGYVLSGSPVDGTNSTARLVALFQADTAGTSATDVAGNSSEVTTGGYCKSFRLEAPTYVRIYAQILSGITCPADGYTFYPMLEKGSVVHSFVSPNVNGGAASTATKFITKVNDTGISIHPANSSGNDALHINATSIDFLRNNVSTLAMTDTDLRLGKSAGNHVRINNSGMTVYTGTESASTAVASYGSTIRIGVADNNRVEIGSSSSDAYVNVYSPNTNGGLYCNQNVYAQKNVSAGASVVADTAVHSKGTLTVDGTAAFNRGVNIYKVTSDPSIGVFCSQPVTVENNLYCQHLDMPNHSALRAKDTGGTLRNLAYLNNSNQYIYANTSYPTRIYGSTLWMSSQPTYGSDKRLKRNIKELSSDSDELMLNIKPVQYEWDDSYEGHSRGINLGFIAQDVEAQMKSLGMSPDAYHLIQQPQSGDAYYSLSYTEFIPMLTHLVQSQQKEIDQLKEEIRQLKSEAK